MSRGALNDPGSAPHSHSEWSCNYFHSAILLILESETKNLFIINTINTDEPRERRMNCGVMDSTLRPFGATL
jgi:hypothetical protein